MKTDSVTAVWFTDGWARAYQNRASAYGHRMPVEEQQRMLKALARMYGSERRENVQRIAIGKRPIWFMVQREEEAR